MLFLITKDPALADQQPGSGQATLFESYYHFCTYGKFLKQMKIWISVSYIARNVWNDFNAKTHNPSMASL
jgi:hypothetical protein